MHVHFCQFSPFSQRYKCTVPLMMIYMFLSVPCNLLKSDYFNLFAICKSIKRADDDESR